MAIVAFERRIPAAPETTFSGDVAPILYAKCVACHRPGEVAPMALRTYDEVRPYARAIKEKVVSRQMPPWMADPAIGHFTNDPSLSPDEVDTIVRWVDGGTARGDAADLPPLPVFPEGWQLGEPDLVVDLPEIAVPPAGRDLFINKTVTLNLPEERWIRAVEVRPGNRQVAHHAVFFNGGSGLATLSSPANVLAVWAAGTPPTVYPIGMGRKIRKGQVITANLHYHPNGTATTDRTRIGLYFGTGDLRKEVATGVAGNVVFEIPPNEPRYEMTATYVADQDIRIISLFPHMHLRGRDMKLTAKFPDGRTQDLLNVPAYDFNWQLFYYPTAPISIPRGTRIDVVAHYDNSVGNRANPDPSRTITYGETTDDEMMFGTFEFVAAEGVSPQPPDDRMRLQTMLAGKPQNSAFLVDVPFPLGRLNAGLYLPRSGDGAWYVALAPGVVVTLPVTHVIWNGEAYQFVTKLRLLGFGGEMLVNGNVSTTGSIQGTVKPAAAGGFAPFTSFSGARRP
jgi:hypothetical protein